MLRARTVLVIHRGTTPFTALWCRLADDLLPEEATRLTALTCLCITLGLPRSFERAQAPKPEWRLPLAAPGLRYLKLVEVDAYNRHPAFISCDVLPPLEHNLVHLTGAADCLPLACLSQLPNTLPGRNLITIAALCKWQIFSYTHKQIVLNDLQRS